MAMFSQTAWDTARESIQRYRGLFRDQHPGKSFPPVVTADMIVCDDDPVRAKEMARKHIGAYLFNACFRFAGVPEDYAIRGMRPFADRVMPEFP